MGSICKYQLEKDKEYSWIIKILKTQSYQIFFGVSTIKFDLNNSSYESNKNCGWYLFLQNSSLYSGPPHNYQGHNSKNINKKKDEIKVVMNMKKRTLQFLIDNEIINSYSNIPIDVPIVPSVMLYNINDSIEILEC